MKKLLKALILFGVIFTANAAEPTLRVANINVENKTGQTVSYGQTYYYDANFIIPKDNNATILLQATGGFGIALGTISNDNLVNIITYDDKSQYKGQVYFSNMSENVHATVTCNGSTVPVVIKKHSQRAEGVFCDISKPITLTMLSGTQISQSARSPW